MTDSQARPLPTDDAPPWFVSAVSHPRTAHAVPAGGIELHMAGWNDGDASKPLLLLVHGFRANSHWWDHIAPFLVQQRRVFALDLSGMGRSGWRSAYTHGDFTADIDAAARWLRQRAPGQPLAVVGHSYGGMRLLEACAIAPEVIDHAIVLDAALADPPVVRRPAAARERIEPRADRASLLARFRLAPEQPALPFARAHIAEHSIAGTATGGWRWQSDPAVLGAFAGAQAAADSLGRVGVPVDLVRGEHSAVVSAAAAARMAALVPGARGPIELPAAHHHLMLDQPLALVALLKTLLDRLPQPPRQRANAEGER